MTTTKKVATQAVPEAPVATKLPAKKAASRKVSSKNLAAKKPLSKAFAPAGSPKTAKPVDVIKVVRPDKPKKPKLVRDSFTIPKDEYVVLEALKQRAAKLARSAKKSELLRAGIKALAGLSDAAFLSALEKVPTIKTGRPAVSR